MDKNLDNFIEEIVKNEITSFAKSFEEDYEPKKGKKAKNILNKNNNVFISTLGSDIMVYSALMRSLDSSLGNRIEKIAKRIAERNYIVESGVNGYMTVDSQNAIARLLEDYKTHRKIPKDDDLNLIVIEGDKSFKVLSEKKSDYYLISKKDRNLKYLLELKIGGDLDNKKAESEKSSLLYQYVTLRYNKEIDKNDKVKIFFCTAYNKFGDNEDWDQTRVMQFFAPGELLIGRDFWNFICNSELGYEIIKKSYSKYANLIRKALDQIIFFYAKKVDGNLKLVSG